MAKKKPGRKRLLTESLIQEICKWVSGGNNYKDACLLSGISEAIFYDWKSRGIEDKENGKKTIFSEFLESLEIAKARWKAWHIENIRKSAEKNWTASAWNLERRCPEEFGRRDYLQHQGYVVNADAGRISKKQKDKLKDKLRELFK